MAKRISFVLGSCLAVMATLGCVPATNFQGEPQFPGGARGCWDRCRADGLEMASFVYVGEYSTACACRPRPIPGMAPSAITEQDQAAVVAAAAGVELQRRRYEEERRRRQSTPYPGAPY